VEGGGDTKGWGGGVGGISWGGVWGGGEGRRGEVGTWRAGGKRVEKTRGWGKSKVLGGGVRRESEGR